MKLILKQYLASLRERGELDAILPDLLSQMGLNVFSRPGRGTVQHGVDVGAVGSLNNGPEKVYLFSIKAGDLTKREWDGDSDQSLRPSLNQIIDAYIPSRLPSEHREKNIVICICVGGDILEPVRPLLTGYMSQNTTPNIQFEEWYGDKLASLIQSNFLREDLLPEHARSRLRKSLAMLDEPETSYKHFAQLIKSLSTVDSLGVSERVTALRQMSICLWILLGWAREAENMESAYLSSELVLLHGWGIVKLSLGEKRKIPQGIEKAFYSIFTAYQKICSEFLAINVLPHVGKRDALSSAIRTSCSLDINLKLFDLLGRLGTYGIWAYWTALQCSDEKAEEKQHLVQKLEIYSASIKALISNNPVLFLPIKDDQAIDMAIAISVLSLDQRDHIDIRNWLSEVLNRASFAYQVHGLYPCILSSYSELLSHPQKGNNQYQENVTSGSVLYPMIALWAAMLNDEKIYSQVTSLKQKHLSHCNFQLWFPDEHSEKHFYTNSDLHGAVLSDACVDRPQKEFLGQVFGECDQSPHYEDLSAVKSGWWPLIFVACRHYRLPLPIHFWKDFAVNSNTY